MWRRRHRTTAVGTWPAQFGVLTGAHRCRAFPNRNASFKQVCGTRGAPKCKITFLPHWSTRDTAPPGPAPVGIGAVAGTPNKRGGIQIEGRVEQQQQRYQLAAHPLLADVDSETIQGLFDANIMVEDSAFCDLLVHYASLEMISLVTPRTERFSKSMVNERRWCVISTCYCALQLREQIEQQSGDFDIARLPHYCKELACVAFARSRSLTWRTLSCP